MLRRVLLGGVALALLGAISLIIMYMRLTAPVEVASSPPIAPTLALPTAAPGVVTPTAVPPTVVMPIAPTPSSAPVSGQPSVIPTSASANPPTFPTSETAQVYRVDAAQSEASYAVKENFFDRRGLFTVTGITKAIAGDILVDRTNPAASRLGEIVVDISQLRSDDRDRDNAIRRGYLESARYPRATFKNATLSDLPSSLTEGQPFGFKVTGDLTVRQTTHQITRDVEATLDGDSLRGRAITHTKISIFMAEPLSLAGRRLVEDDIDLTLNFVALRVSSP